jgi:hypothetical protein
MTSRIVPTTVAIAQTGGSPVFPTVVTFAAGTNFGFERPFSAMGRV